MLSAITNEVTSTVNDNSDKINEYSKDDEFIKFNHHNHKEKKKKKNKKEKKKKKDKKEKKEIDTY
jgi:hypothetical protein